MTLAHPDPRNTNQLRKTRMKTQLTPAISMGALTRIYVFHFNLSPMSKKPMPALG
jgi:hypothetical protein